MQQDPKVTFRRIRPKVRFQSHLSPGEVISKLREHLKKTNATCEGQTTVHFASIYPPEDQQHFWSPQLTLTFDETDTGCTVKGLFGPRPSVWTMFVFFYSVIGFAFFMVTMIALSFYSLQMENNLVWLIPVLLAILLSLFLVAYAGQKFGHRQIIIIQKFVEEALDIKLEIN